MAAKTRGAKKVAAAAKSAARGRKTKPARTSAAAKRGPKISVARVPAKPRPTAPSLPAPPPRPAPPPTRDELIAPRDIGRLLRYGERFGPHRIDIKMLHLQLPVASNALAVCDPGAPKSWRTFDRPIAGGVFRVMLAIARPASGAPDAEQLAAVVVHVGRPPIAKWTVAHYRGQKKPKSPDQLPRCAVTTGWLALVDAGDGPPGPIAVPAEATTSPIEVPLTDGRRALALPCGNGDYAAYWAVDAEDRPICLVVDFDVFTQKEWKARPT